MAEDEFSIDLSIKKKKKKKTPFNEDLLLSSSTPEVKDKPDEEQHTEEKDTPQTEEINFDEDFMSSKKKKKKKKVQAFNLGENEESTPDSNTTESKPTDENDFGDFSMLDKKRKPKKAVKIEDLDGLDEHDGSAPSPDGSTWADSDRDYTYDELLKRVFDIMHEKNPDMVAGEKKRYVMKPPQVMRVGAKKSSFSNFSEICKMLHRQPKHLLAFLLAELGTNGSIDGNNQLIIKGRFQQKQIENVLRRYIKEYVTCHTCHSPDTILQKDTRLFFLQCEKCGSRCSVASIKSGFQAVTSKRSAIRAKTT